MKAFIFWIALILPAGALPAAEESSEWINSIVTIDINRIQYNYYQPWARQPANTRKTGVAIAGGEILTTADWLQNATLVRVQKHGRGRWWNASIRWIDYHANLAVLTVADPAFWKDVRPAAIAPKPPVKGEVEIWRMADGNLQGWKGTISKLFVQAGQRTYAQLLTLEISSDMNAGGWSEVVTRGGKICALVSSQDANRLWAIPSNFIQFVLDARKRDAFTGLGTYDFDWQFLKNPATVRFLGLGENSGGVLVTHVPETSAFAGKLLPRDVILEIDGFAIDADGDYRDPEFGHLSFLNLSTRGRLAGDESRFKVWRAGKKTDVSVRPAPARYESRLVPDAVYDEAPKYVIAGGLVFQPLTVPYLQSWGARWRESVPFRLNYYKDQEPTAERPHLVLLSTVLPDPYNLGYQDYEFLIVDRINGLKIGEPEQVVEALKHPKGGYHVVEFAPNREVQKIVLDAGEMETATRRIIEKYGIPKAVVTADGQAKTQVPRPATGS